MTTDKRFAQNVARELDRRRSRRRVLFGGGFAGLIALAVMYLRCGSGFGLGGTGTGSGDGTGSSIAPPETGLRRCQVRVGPGGITVDGKPATRHQALEICRHTAGADVVVTGDARHGDWAELEAALKAAKIDISVHQGR